MEKHNIENKKRKMIKNSKEDGYQETQKTENKI